MPRGRNGDPTHDLLASWDADGAFVHGTDNMTARSALVYFMFTEDGAMTDELQSLRLELEAVNSELVPVYVPGTVMVADERSRGKPPRRVVTSFFSP